MRAIIAAIFTLLAVGTGRAQDHPICPPPSALQPHAQVPEQPIGRAQWALSRCMELMRSFAAMQTYCMPTRPVPREIRPTIKSETRDAAQCLESLSPPF